ncbi:hypothetical protein BV898_05406 [Hypsibius exemplaris]|uniref:Uncharacterized protein n=1 Tax=Hypsibius exemplaris TaxID=2072580 RepID=A0A1W0WZJ5_HYPEX|nr:hypothetical protein BV898_05406 [Hypsibius exemplaris]
MDLAAECVVLFFLFISRIGVEWSVKAAGNVTGKVRIPCLNELNSVLDTCQELIPSGRQLIQEQRQNNELLLTLLLFWHNNRHDDFDQINPEEYRSQLTANCRAYLGDTGAAAGSNLGGLVGGGVLGFLGSQLLTASRTPCQVCSSTCALSFTAGIPTACNTTTITNCNLTSTTGLTACQLCLIPTQTCTTIG